MLAVRVARFQQQEIALEQQGGCGGSWSFLAGVFVFVNVGFDQVGHFTGVHLHALTVTNLRGHKHIQLWLLSFCWQEA